MVTKRIAAALALIDVRVLDHAAGLRVGGYLRHAAFFDPSGQSIAYDSTLAAIAPYL
jgi:hypothetical protein